MHLHSERVGFASPAPRGRSPVIPHPTIHPQAEALSTLVTALSDPGQGIDPASTLGAFDLDPALATELTHQITQSRRELARLRRREYELGALFASARELAAEHDGAVILKRIVDRAHQMMGSDLTYLSEYDPETRELFVRETIGSVSADFRALRVPPGMGLASFVVEQRTGRSILRYTEVESGRHEDGIDAAVSAEGIVSMLGVPMLADDEVLGVLFVATRDEHVFSAEDTALLTALANHASVVLQSARTLRSLARAEDESRRALATLTEHLTQRDRSHAVHRKLVEAVLTGGDLSTVATTLSEELACPIELRDPMHNLLACAGGNPPATRDFDDATRSALSRSADSGHLTEVDSGPFQALVAVAAGDRHLGTILLGKGDFPLSDVDARTVERAGQVFALLLLSQEAISEAEYRVHSELIADLLSADPQRRQDAISRGRQRQIYATDLTALLALSVPAGMRGRAVRAAAAATPNDMLVGEHQGLVIVLGREDLARRAEEIRQAVAQRLGSEVLGVIPPTGESGFHFSIVRKTVRLLDALKVSDTLVATTDYIPYAAAFDTDDTAMTLFLQHSLGEIKRYDAERGTELLRTLRAFIHNGGSPTQTARALNFHVNTILQRLDRLDRLLEDNWRTDETYFRISMAVRVDELRERFDTQDAGYH